MTTQGPQYSIRPARKSECRRIAELYRIASDGVADYIWTKLAQPGEDILDVGRRRYEREGTPFSYENCKMVELRGSVVGGFASAGGMPSFTVRLTPRGRAMVDAWLEGKPSEIEAALNQGNG
jgi:hypothetical protein